MTIQNSKTVLITGATSGIGEATAYAFAKLGWNVLITYHSDEVAAKRVVQKCLELGSQNSKYYHLDLESDESILNLQKFVQEDFESIDVLVNNAGYMSDYNKSGLLKDLSFDDINKIVNVNLTGMIKITKELSLYVKGTIINIGSILAKGSRREYSVYAASKWGVLGFTKSLALELSDLKVFCINPGPTKTRLNDFWEGGVEPESVATIIRDVVLGKIPVESGGDVDVWELIN